MLETPGSGFTKTLRRESAAIRVSLVLLVFGIVSSMTLIVSAQSALPGLAAADEPVVVELKRLSDAAWYAIAAMVGTLITSVTALGVALAQGNKLTQIHTLTNSSLSTAKASLDAAVAKNQHLAELLARVEQEKALIISTQTAADLLRASVHPAAAEPRGDPEGKT